MPGETKDLKQLFLQKKPCQILLAAGRIEKPYISTLMREADTTFAHATNILAAMEAHGLIVMASEGRMKYVRLTATGRELARSLRSVDGLLDGRLVLRKLSNLDMSIDRLEANARSDVRDEKTKKARVKRLAEISGRWAAIGDEAARYENPALATALSRMKERIDYLESKIAPRKEAPQDT